MKKTLLIAAAALAVGVISTKAQVYSQNIVGYVNQTIPAHHYEIVGGTLINGSDANQTNGDVNTTLINGLVSSPNDVGVVPFPANCTNSQMIYWNGSGYSTFYYYNQADATTWEGSPSPAGWYFSDGTPSGKFLPNGYATFIYNNSAISMTVTTTGNVLNGATNMIPVHSGYNMLCAGAPISTNPVSYLPPNLHSYVDPGNPTAYTPDLNHNDAAILWNGSGFSTWFFFNSADATAWFGGAQPADFYQQDGTELQQTPSAFPQVNQGYFLYHIGSTVTWTNTFTAQ